MKKELRWADLEGRVPASTLGIWMDIAEEEMGDWPEWTDIIPDWVYRLLNLKNSEC